MRTEKFKMERPDLVHVGDEVEISEHGTTILSYIIEPAVAMSGCYNSSNRILSTHGTVVRIDPYESAFYVYVEFES
ncbi:hypothetical protein [Anaerolentibacter hominis]|uniref:hypothetical protein n=1 Tax=Anaerolentibacter hominis TaxID=3079009 RepID=UPI0031B89315